MTASEGDGNGWVVSAGGDRRWGRFGAAGLLLRAADPTDPDTPLVLLQHRAVWTASGDTWALPGGAIDSGETPAEAAARETFEEAGATVEVVHVPSGTRSTIVTDANGNVATVTQADVLQSNGVVHVIDTVLMPAM